MQLISFVTLLLISARAIAAEQIPKEVSNSQSVHPTQQAGPVVVSQVEPAQVHQPQSGVPYYHGQYQQSSNVGGVSSYYSPAAGIIQVVPTSSFEPGSIANKPIGSSPSVHHYASSSSLGSVPSAGVEQYGQPESASIPANYKPFGSWGLYIGGNPADGYYTNYYKSLASGGPNKEQSSSVVPSQSEQQVVPPKPGQQGSFLKQAFVSPSSPAYGAGNVPNGEPVYSYDHSYYTPADLSSGVARFASPAHVAAGYGTPSASFEPSSSVSAYAADTYAVKKFAPQQKEVPQQQQQLKGYQARSGYFYSSAVPSQQQVVAYPVPVGSQIVGSQPGIDGAFYPYGVHAFTRYAVKPTVVNSGEPQSTYYQSAPAQVAYPGYKQQSQPQYHQQQFYQAPQYQSLGFYGYPLSQLHYSTGMIKPEQQPSMQAGAPEQVGLHSPVGLVSQPVEAASEKSETSHQVVSDKQQKKA